MVGGVDFRNAIVDAVKTCTIFLPLINDAWAKSGECSDEFSLAKRLHLTSHETGRTERNQPRLPIFIPFAFSDLDWNAHPHIQLLAASTNFLVHDAPTLESGNVQKRVDDLLLSMNGAGLKVDLPERIKPETNEKQNINQKSSTDPRAQLLSITESLKAFATSIQAFASINSDKDMKAKQELESSNLVIAKEYLGI